MEIKTLKRTLGGSLLGLLILAGVSAYKFGDPTNPDPEFEKSQNELQRLMIDSELDFRAEKTAILHVNECASFQYQALFGKLDGHWQIQKDNDFVELQRRILLHSKISPENIRGVDKFIEVCRPEGNRFI